MCKAAGPVTAILPENRCGAGTDLYLTCCPARSVLQRERLRGSVVLSLLRRRGITAARAAVISYALANNTTLSRSRSRLQDRSRARGNQVRFTDLWLRRSVSTAEAGQRAAAQMMPCRDSHSLARCQNPKITTPLEYEPTPRPPAPRRSAAGNHA